MAPVYHSTTITLHLITHRDALEPRSATIPAGWHIGPESAGRHEQLPFAAARGAPTIPPDMPQEI